MEGKAGGTAGTASGESQYGVSVRRKRMRNARQSSCPHPGSLRGIINIRCKGGYYEIYH